MERPRYEVSDYIVLDYESDLDSKGEDEPTDLRVPQIVGADAYARYGSGDGSAAQEHILFDADSPVVTLTASNSAESMLDFSNLTSGRYKRSLSYIISTESGDSSPVNIFRDEEKKVKAIVIIEEDKNLAIIGVRHGKGYAVRKEFSEYSDELKIFGGNGDVIKIADDKIINPLDALAFAKQSKYYCDRERKGDLRVFWNDHIKSGVIDSWENRFGTEWRDELGVNWKIKMRMREEKKSVH